MPDYYYQIKGKLSEPQQGFYGSSQNWSFPPLFSGKVTANDKKEAKKLVDEQYGKAFPLRVLNKDLDSNEFLLNLEEIKEGSRIHKLFDKQTCLQCSEPFYVIDKYNDINQNNKGFEYCSDGCKNEHNEVERYKRNQSYELSGNENPLIYKITNKETGLCYIGKTTQVFTLRWYQHFFQSGDNKFHAAIKNYKVSSWIFEIIEIIHIPDSIKMVAEIEKLIIERERYWINHYNSIEEGYNSI